MLSTITQSLNSYGTNVAKTQNAIADYPNVSESDRGNIMQFNLAMAERNAILGQIYNMAIDQETKNFNFFFKSGMEESRRLMTSA